jgi:hypothetical protein
MNQATSVITALKSTISHTNCRRGSLNMRNPMNTPSVESRSPAR